LHFFFSSRRRHTSSKRDWSSDVCSSDLLHLDAAGGQCIEVLVVGQAVDVFQSPQAAGGALDEAGSAVAGRTGQDQDAVLCAVARSEERRVGNEWRRWGRAEPPQARTKNE